MDSSVLPKDEILFLRMCHHISKAVYIMQMSLLRSNIGKKVLQKAVGDRHCQNVLRDVFSSPAVCLLRKQNFTTGLGKRPFYFI